jgi:hypothetical protein
LADSRIQHDLTNPHTPEQNGGAKRENRTLVESVQAMLHSKRLSLWFWREAIQTAAYVFNRMGSCTRGNKTPYELWTGTRPVVDHLRIFGSIAYAHVPKSFRKKLDPKSVKTICVGYYAETKAYRLWDDKHRRIMISRDIIFDEFAMPDKPVPETFSGVFMIHHADTTNHGDS